MKPTYPLPGQKWRPKDCFNITLAIIRIHLNAGVHRVHFIYEGDTSEVDWERAEWITKYYEKL